jgi:non-homologous end joining protein Ku
MLEAKREGRAVKATQTRRLAPVIDLMAALQKSLGETAEKKPAGRSMRAEAADSEKPARRTKRVVGH